MAYIRNFFIKYCNFLKRLWGKNNYFPPYSYDFIMQADEKDYPLYLSRIYESIFLKKLDFNNVRTFNEKIQWLKLYDCSPLKTRLTDKVLVRDWIKEQIGSDYLKPVLQICSDFDEINFDKLPDKFIIKANNGCKWHFIVKNKKELLTHLSLMKHIRKKFKIWKSINYMPQGHFELQYKDIEFKILIEPYLINEEELFPTEYEIFCFNGEPQIYQKVRYSSPPITSVYNQDFSNAEFKINDMYILAKKPADDLLKQAVKLSKILAKSFKFVRVDWFLFSEKIYFNEMTFTPFSGFCFFENEKVDDYMGSLIKI